MQTILQNVSKQLVISIPLAIIIQSRYEQVRTMQLFQHRLSFRFPAQRVAEGSVHPLENGGLQQEVPDLFGLEAEYLVDEIIYHVVMTPCKRGDEILHI